MVRKLLMCCIFVLILVWLVNPKTADAASTYVNNPQRVSVHDPSIFRDEDGMYYIFGSHLADARSADLINWTSMNPDWNSGGRNWQADSVYKGSVGDVVKNFAKPFRWAGYHDADQANGIGVWAPDVIYNPYYVWTDGSGQIGAYMLYFCTSSTWKRSCIGFAVSKRAIGPYDAVDTLVYSGFSKDGAFDGNSTINTRWDNNYLNLAGLIADGTIDDISDKWFNGDGWNHRYAPNAIDPNVFFDKDDNMYMSYGSWSGGLFILPLDKETGKAIYPGEDSTDEISGNFVDRYFGVHIAGGNHQSGEGPYIIYDEETDYYYMYETYGSLLASGGYNMRLFRSKHVYGPYLDAEGNNSADSGSNNTKYGIKLIGNYNFSNQTAYKAAGHNSVLIDEDGHRYIIYHQRFSTNDYFHEIRVRRQYLNEDKWPVETVYEYRDTDEEIDNYEISDMIGTYEIINHGTSTDGNMIASQSICLNGDGTVTGDVTGAWRIKDSGRGYDYIKITTDDTTYKGYFLKQYTERLTTDKVMTFSAIGSDNTCLWGSQTSSLCPVPEIDEEVIIELPEPEAPIEEPTEQPIEHPIVEPTKESGGNVKNDTSDINPVPEKVLSRAIFKSIKNKKKNQAILKWKNVVGADGYQIQYSKKKKFKPKKSINTVNVNDGKKTKITIKNIKSAKLYYFRIRAYQKINNKKVFGKWSAVKKLILTRRT